MLEESGEERDLGVIIDESLIDTRQQQLRKQILFWGLLKVLLPWIHKHYHYCTNQWRPHKVDQVMVEKVQKRATKLIPCIRHLPYDQRLKILKLPSLMYRRRRGDMLQTFKIVTNRVNINKDKFLKLNEMQTRGHQYKLRKPMSTK